VRAFIFVTYEGYTYQPNSISVEPDIDNLQVLGFAFGEQEEQAFENLMTENEWLLATSFDEIECLELKHLDFHAQAGHFYLKDRRPVLS
jgi:hypothetical protein